jgi:hypothetical protein
MFSRVNTLQTTADRIDDVSRAVQELVHPGISIEPGYRGYLVLGNRETGKAIGVTLWESAAAREASDAKAREIRPRLEQVTGSLMQSVEQFEVLFSDLP